MKKNLTIFKSNLINLTIFCVCSYLGYFFSKRLGIHFHQSFNQIIFLLIPTIIYLLVTDLKLALKIKKPCLNILIISPIIGIILFLLSNLWLKTLGLNTEFEQTLINQLHQNPFWISIILFAFIPGITEELFFRAVLQNGIATQSNQKTALIISSFLFAICHLTIDLFLFYLLIGLIFGYINQRFGIINAIFSHTLFNLTNLIIYKLTI